MDKEGKLILALDIGTTNIRCFLYNKHLEIVGRFVESIKLEFPEPNAVEMKPDILWDKVVKTIKGCIEDGNVHASDILAMGMSTQRGTFILLDKNTEEPIHDFIVWQDTRATGITNRWNESYIWRAAQFTSKFLYALTRINKLLAAAVLHFRAQHVSMRLLWLFERYPDLKRRAHAGEVMFATLDTWLVWMLTGRKVMATEYSSASSTALYDPYTLSWSGYVCGFLGIPRKIFPQVWDTNADFGVCEPSLFGAEIPIRASAGDQQAAMFGQGCFEEGDTKLTLGTGAFLNLNVGSKPHASVNGFYPVVGWSLDGAVTHLAEGSSNTCGNAITWMRGMKLIAEARDVEAVASQAKSDASGVYFVPAFTGLQAPVNDYAACGAIIGLTLEHRVEDIVLAVLESLAFRNRQLHRSMSAETKMAPGRFVCDGGVSNCDLVVQMTADLIGCAIVRRDDCEMSSLGVALIAGLATGMWRDQTEVLALMSEGRRFESRCGDKYEAKFKEWVRATDRAMRWYQM